MLAAAPSYADEAHAYVLATAAMPRKRGVARTENGDRVLAATCAVDRESTPRLDLATVDYSFVGVAIDATLVSADANVAPLLAEGDHALRLVAVAFVRDRAPPHALAPSPAVRSARGGGCTCGDATHIVGEIRWGALVSYDAPAPKVDHPTRAIDLARKVLTDPHTHARETRIGAMSLDGFAPFLAGRATRPLAMRVTKAAPVAYALRPIDEVCPGAIPAPEVAPSPVDFGVAAYGTEARRSVHLTNRASIDLDAVVGARTIRLPARGAIDLPLAWTPDGDAWRCETQTRDEAIPFVAATPSAGPPREAVARVLETVRTGRPSLARAEPVEPSPRDRRGDPTTRDLACPPDFVPAVCRAEHPLCAGRPCASVTGQTTKTGCHFACRGADGAPCRFDAVMECRLRCPD
jgi:hypothetical protein